MCSQITWSQWWREGHHFSKSITHLICNVTSHIHAQVNFLGASFKTRGRAGILSVSFTGKMAVGGCGGPCMSHAFTCAESEWGESEIHGAAFQHLPGASTDVFSLLSKAKWALTASSLHKCGNWGWMSLCVFLPYTYCVSLNLNPGLQTLNPTLSHHPQRDMNGRCAVHVLCAGCRCTYTSS